MNSFKLSHRFTRALLLLLILGSLTGCLHWMRAFQTYLQLGEFDKYFIVDDKQTHFTLYFNKPTLFNKDLVLLSKLQPSSKKNLPNGEQWRYKFRKVDKKQKVFKPELSFFFDLNFDKQHKVSAWIFSPLFLEIAPAKFLEASLRSLAGGEIDKEKRQLKAKSHVKVDAKLPQKKIVVGRLGKPIKIEDKEDEEIYFYHFLLDTHDIEKGYEDRALSIIQLNFDKKTNELTRMAGRFAGLKVSIKYRRYLNKK